MEPSLCVSFVGFLHLNPQLNKTVSIFSCLQHLLYTGDTNYVAHFLFWLICWFRSRSPCFSALFPWFTYHLNSRLSSPISLVSVSSSSDTAWSSASSLLVMIHSNIHSLSVCITAYASKFQSINLFWRQRPNCCYHYNTRQRSRIEYYSISFKYLLQTKSTLKRCVSFKCNNHEVVKFHWETYKLVLSNGLI